ncbi:Alpha/Beta hydrolase protein [Chaetomium strumarium]|uniref:Alpha/Beta hydrolase protein n=1 Tax=Chaetomium strumarium TaxID=1170767 RepID=A0AAJ0M2C9_9PEZI|nr:Alpha/Beta hydrolase protein [Chaetomium strumarium]
MADAAAVAADGATVAPGSSETGRLVAPPVSLPERLKYSLIAFVLQKLLTNSRLWIKATKKYFVPPDPNEPDLVKTYPVRKSLPIRIFFPPGHNPSTKGATSTKLPTLLTIHGGGFVVGSANDNDNWNRTFSTRNSFLVVALNYAKAPGNPFPGPIYDVETLIGCVLSDSSLPVDTNRVALAGWSAGGNLVLAASQLPSLQGRIHAAVPFYPLTDRTTTSEQKARGRRYKPALGGFRGKDEDFLLAMSGLFNWAYLNPGTRLDDPLLAGRRIPGLDEVVGRQEEAGKGVLITEGDERFAWETTREDGSRYRWLLVPDTIHGHDQDNIDRLVKDPVLMEDARIKKVKVIDLVGQWLLDGPLRPKARS